MNERDLLRMFDYLSTVSGGGFTGGWWSAWLARPGRAANERFPPPEELEPARRPPQLRHTRAVLPMTPPGLPDGSRSAYRQDPIHHLRLFANYLTPRRGMLSADTWGAGTFFARNLLFTWLVLLPLFLSVIIAGQLYFLASGPVALGFVCSAPEDVKLGPVCERLKPPSRVEAIGLRLEHLAAPLVVAGILMTTLSLLWLLHATANWFVAALAIGAASGVVGWLFRAVANPSTSGWGPLIRAALVVSGAIVLIHGLNVLEMFIAGPVPNDAHRTRLAQWHTRMLAATTGLGALLLLAAFGHEVVLWLFGSSGGAVPIVARQAGGWGALFIAIASAAFTAYSTAPSARAHDTSGLDGRAARIVFAATPYLVAIVLAVTLAWSGHGAIYWWSTHPQHLRALGHALAAISVLLVVLTCYEGWREAIEIRVRRLAVVQEARGVERTRLGKRTILLGGLATAAFLASRALSSTGDDPRAVFLWAGVGCFVLSVSWTLAFGWLVDPNLLGLHAFYKARLVRAYLGASNTQREYEDITDTAPGDDVLLTELCNHGRGVPYHIINTTLNLVGAHDLATAQRSSASFVLSQYYCGSSRTGYRCTDEYMSGQLSLGTALAISGAAAAPNMGSKTPSVIPALLLTLLNVRLGFWAPTPHRERWQEPQPRLWPLYLLRECLSRTTDDRSYCYLTDGGHFDNTGLYSLVERGCRYIVLLDCGADPRPSFADLGEAIRRCRIDFGTEIDLDVGEVLATTTRNFSARDHIVGTLKAGDLEVSGEAILLRAVEQLARRHYVIGRITYHEEHWRMLGWSPTDDRTGTIVWIKPRVTPADTADVRQYHLENDNFPQQATFDQWYDEAQFESYRKLGYDSVMAALPALQGPLGRVAIQAYFEALHAR